MFRSLFLQFKSEAKVFVVNLVVKFFFIQSGVNLIIFLSFFLQLIGCDSAARTVQIQTIVSGKCLKECFHNWPKVKNWMNYNCEYFDIIDFCFAM